MSSAHEQWMAAYDEVTSLPTRNVDLLHLLDVAMTRLSGGPREVREACEILREVRQEARALSPDWETAASG